MSSTLIVHSYLILWNFEWVSSANLNSKWAQSLTHLGQLGVAVAVNMWENFKNWLFFHIFIAFANIFLKVKLALLTILTHLKLTRAYHYLVMMP